MENSKPASEDQFLGADLPIPQPSESAAIERGLLSHAVEVLKQEGTASEKGVAAAKLVEHFWGEVVGRFRGRMRRIPHAVVGASDIANMAFVEALAALTSGRANKTVDRNGFRALVGKIAEDRYVDELRRLGTIKRPDRYVRGDSVFGVDAYGRPRSLADAVADPSTESNFEEDCADALSRIFDIAHRVLSAEELDLLTSRANEETNAQIADRLGCSVRIVQLRWNNLLEKLRAAIASEG